VSSSSSSSSSFYPEPVARIGEVMSTFNRPWFVCGGWAVDTWLGRQTREHGDIDITVFHDDQRALFEQLAGWHMIADDIEPDTSPDRPPWDGHVLDPEHRWTWPKTPAHIHARPAGVANLAALRAWTNPPYSTAADDFNLEVMINEREGSDWLVNPEPRIARPIELCVRESPAGIPTAVPEVLMFFKATAYWGEYEGKYPRAADEADVRALLPQVGEDERSWLREAISRLVPDHPWLPLLSG
jgi:hypothetical protein